MKYIFNVIIILIVSNAIAQNQLRTGSTPYAYCYGENLTCNSYGCSEIRVKTPYNSDVMVTIKKNNRVVKHAYIQGGDSYTFSFPNGTYQAFFYYGQNWKSSKLIKSGICGGIRGGFNSDESFGKDSPKNLNNQALTYELILQENGNFSTKPSNPDEAF